MEDIQITLYVFDNVVFTAGIYLAGGVVLLKMAAVLIKSWSL